MKPCDCKSIDETTRLLNEQGVTYNDDSITVIPSYVLLKMGHTEIKIPMSRFELFAKWYLEDQTEKEE